MPRARDVRFARLAAGATAADDAAAWRGAALRARIKIGEALRQSLAHLRIDPASLAMLRISSDATAELAVSPGGRDTGAPPRVGDPCNDASPDAFAARLEQLMRRCHDGRGLDFAQASLAEALAWCLARLRSSAPMIEPKTPPPDGRGRGPTFCC